MRSIHDAVFRWICFKNEKRTEALRRVLTTNPEVTESCTTEHVHTRHDDIPQGIY